jgi:hypothetical protein
MVRRVDRSRADPDWRRHADVVHACLNHRLCFFGVCMVYIWIFIGGIPVACSPDTKEARCTSGRKRLAAQIEGTGRACPVIPLPGY